MPYAMTSRQNVLALLTANLLIPLAILTFATGFFPYKPFIAGRASFRDDDVQSAPFDKVIFMVVDALRRCASLPPYPQDSAEALFLSVTLCTRRTLALSLPKGM